MCESVALSYGTNKDQDIYLYDSFFFSIPFFIFQVVCRERLNNNGGLI